MKTYISVNVVSQSLLMIECLNKYQCHRLSDIALLRPPFNISFDVSLNFAKQCEWILESEENVEFSDVGITILSMFNGEIITKALWMVILFQYISVCQPAWSKRIPYGRKEAYLFMNEEEQRCFLEAGLIDSQEDEVLDWWDSLAVIERSKNYEQKNDVGRQGEKLTVLYEETRTGVQPDWIAIETNLVGYDILSRRSTDNAERILIEVKTSTQSIENAFAIISRNEWDTASKANNRGRYLFYFWSISSSHNKLAKITVDEMQQHIPIDGKMGVWDNAKVPFAAFRTRFSSMIALQFPGTTIQPSQDLPPT